MTLESRDNPGSDEPDALDIHPETVLLQSSC